MTNEGVGYRYTLEARWQRRGRNGYGYVWKTTTAAPMTVTVYAKTFDEATGKAKAILQPINDPDFRYDFDVVDVKQEEYAL